MYKPAHSEMSGFWCIPHQGLVHMFALDHSAAAAHEPAEERIGHATSRDLITWEEQPTVLERGAAGEWDGLALGTGSCVEHEGRFFMAYTGISAADRIQRIGVAVSDDLLTWTKSPENPVLVPDPEYYEVPEPGSDVNAGWAAWRDPWLMWDDSSHYFYAFISARLNEGDPHERGCIALARSRDAREWEVLPPLTAPGLYHDMEAPQILDAQGRWYLIHSTHTWRYSEMARLQIPEELVQNGAHYLWSSDCLSGWRVPLVDVFAGSKGESPYGARVVSWEGKRVFLHWGPGRRALALPKELLIAEDGGLACGYYDGLDAYREGFVFPPVQQARMVRTHDLFGEARNFIMEAEITLDAGRVGFVCGSNSGTRGYAALLNLIEQRIEAVSLADGTEIAYQPWSAPPGETISLKLVCDGDVLDVYANDRFALAFRIPQPHEGEIGIIAEGGTALFRNIRADKTRFPMVP